MEYVVGFLFQQGRVCLIEKKRPGWQSGRLNGVGGHIEKYEAPFDAMVREFQEEAGAKITDWREFCLVWGDTYKLYCFTSRDTDACPRTMTDEHLVWVSQTDLPDKALPNLKWLIPLALYEQDIKARIEHQSERC